MVGALVWTRFTKRMSPRRAPEWPERTRGTRSSESAPVAQDVFLMSLRLRNLISAASLDRKGKDTSGATCPPVAMSPSATRTECKTSVDCVIEFKCESDCARRIGVGWTRTSAQRSDRSIPRMWDSAVEN